MVAELLRKCIWLIQTLIRAGDRGLTLDELNRRWELRFGESYPRKTFNNHRSYIEEIFGIEIECNRADNSYFIRYADDVADENAAAAWLINTFTVNNILALGKERLSGRVSVEDIPSGHRHLTFIMDAMLNGEKLKVVHAKYASTEEKTYTIRPYALKESSKRWYLVGFCEEKDCIRVYGLDRIRSIEATGGHFEMPPDFDVDGLFSDCFGVYRPESAPVEIRFRAVPIEAKYLRDLPLHRSQKELSSDEKGTVFSIFVRPDTSLFLELQKLGPNIEVLSPAEIRDEMASKLRKALELYEN